MNYDELLKRLDVMAEGATPVARGRPYDIGDYWNVCEESAAAIRSLQAKLDGYKGLLEGHAIVIKQVEAEKADLQAKLDAATQAGTFQQGVPEGFVVVLEADKRIAEAVHECKADTFECPKCGHSEPWWTESNADYASREPDTNDRAMIGKAGE